DADRDIDDAAAYLIEHANVDLALRFYACVDSAFTRILERPSIGRRRDFEHALLRDVRSWRVPNFDDWLVFYHLTNSAVVILNVLHGARYIDGLFEQSRD